MEDKQVSVKGARNDGEVDGENGTNQNSRPLRGKHVGADSPFGSIGRNPHPRQEAERRDEDTRPWLNELVFHDFYENTRELRQAGVFDPDNLQTRF